MCNRSFLFSKTNGLFERNLTLLRIYSILVILNLNFIMKQIVFILLFFFSLSRVEANISLTDEESLLYIIEEEKLARDVYEHLYSLWGSNQFNNIKSSEQTHMNTVAQLLVDNNISYTLLAPGMFNNTDLQTLYNQLITQGSISLMEAFKVGMTIEDVDIYDLQIRIAETSNQAIIDAYNFLICGSKNHMRAFYNGLNNTGGTYAPQFITVDEYNTILSGSNGPCVLAAEEYYYNPSEIVANTLVKDQLHLLLTDYSKLFLYASNGTLIETYTQFQQDINVSNYANGIYFVKIIHNGKVYVVKIIKQ